jgi:L-aspartate oxidase
LSRARPGHSPPGRIDEVVASDVVVVGAGIAGLAAALGAGSRRRVTVLTKAPLGAGGASPWAQGGIAAAVGRDDSPELHAEDTLAAGAGIADPEVVELLTAEGPRRIERLLRLGTRFDRDARGDLALGREGAHGRRRILRARGDATGAEIVRALIGALGEAPGVTVAESAFATDLVMVDGRVAGVAAIHDAFDGGARRILHRAPAVVLATGGIGRAYLHTTNPPEATGDGLAMAARAGARLADLEFVQFHPTALAAPGADPLPLLTEALRGEGALLVDEQGRRFLLAEDPRGELAPRDVVARAIWRELQSGRRVFLDAREAVGEGFPERFPTVFRLCRAHGFDPRREALPVVPAAHYHMGGVAVDHRGRTSLVGLWACGEVSSTGVHGANRLASNSLLEALVFGARVAEDLRLPLPAPANERAARGALPTSPAARRVAADETPLTELRRTMWERVGVVRDEAGLEAAVGELDRLTAETGDPAEAGGELRNLLTAGKLVAMAALRRRESRGSHFRSDYPAADPEQRRRVFWTLPALATAAAGPARALAVP